MGGFKGNKLYIFRLPSHWPTSVIAKPQGDEVESGSFSLILKQAGP